MTYAISKHQQLQSSSPWGGALLMYTPRRAFSDTSVKCAAQKPKPLAPKPLFGARTSQTSAIVKPRSRVRAPQDPRAILAQTFAPIATAPEPQDELPLEQRILQHRKTHDLNPELLGPAIGALWDQIEFDRGYTERLKLLDAQIAAAAAAQDTRPLEIPTFKPSPADLELDVTDSADLARLEPIDEREIEQVDPRQGVERFIERVRELESRLFDIRCNIMFHDISVSNFLDTVLKKLYHEDIYVGRVRKLTRFWNSIEVSVRKRRRSYLDSQSWLHKVNSLALRDVVSYLKYLGESPGVPQKTRSVFMKYDRLLGIDKRHISVAGHTWRKYMSTGLYLSENSSVPEAWAFDISYFATSDAFMRYRKAIHDTIEEIDSTIQGYRTTPRKHKLDRRQQRLAKMFESNRALLVSSRNDLIHDFSPFVSYAICLFYSRQPTSSIYWKQWEIISPFILSRALILSIRSSVSNLLNVLDVGCRGGYRMPTKLETSLWKWYREFPIIWMDEFIVELEAFTEINFLRLQSEERLTKLGLNWNETQMAVFPNGSDMTKIRHWSMEMSKITGSWSDFTFGDSDTDISRKNTHLTTETSRWYRIQKGVNSGLVTSGMPRPLAGSRFTKPAISRSQSLKLSKAKSLTRSSIRSKLTAPLALPLKPTTKKSKSSDSAPNAPSSKPTKKKSKRTGISSKVGRVDADQPVVLEPTPLPVKGRPIVALNDQHSPWLGGIFSRVPFSKYHTKAANGSFESPSQTSDDRVDTSPPKYWSYDLNKTPDGKDITVHYCTSLQTTERVAARFLSETVVGLDLEWKAQASTTDALVENVSMMQLASKERIAIFHLALFNPATLPQHLVSPTLKRLLESPEIVKVGVAISADCTRLHKFLGIQTTNLCEVSRLYNVVKHHLNPKLINKRLVNLSRQVEEHLGLPLDKDTEIRCGGWSKKLTYRQVHYAATDPYAALQLFHVLEAKRLQLKPVPPSPVHPVIPYSIGKIHPQCQLREHQEEPPAREGELKASIAEN
ncbi:hypothetical protein AJ78_02172 [Emergomyces pasteurianus Ep9510]|uniref:3'-5' exonuclease domain-containing protein n=1 Tax=Emergomyces pasteurianus Ep9510 TaxID=1447872 RepID=A0A1J9QBY7_9EURO|nr:hypothetical protein AJ78_02172 [Emergomyces pasteurianus Ep9510]